MTFYSISKKSEDTKAFNWKIFFQQVLSLSVTFQVNHIGLQQWWSRVCKIKDSDFTVPRCTSHCFARLIFRNNIYVGRQNICKYVEQMVSTYIPISENQFDWFKGVDMEATVRNHIRQMLQNIKSQYISKNCSTNCSKKNNLGYRIQTSVPKFCWPKRQPQSAATTLREHKVLKVYREHLPI